MTNAHASLAKYPLFAALDPAWVASWIASARVARYAVGETLARRGDIPEHLFLIESGRVRVVRSNEGREFTLGSCVAGQLAGDHSLLAPGSLRSTLRVAVPATVRLLPVAPLRAALDSRPELAARLRAWVRLHFALRFLRDETYLGFMSADSFLPLLDRCPTVCVPRGTAVQAEGLNADSYFTIQNGQVVLAPAGEFATGHGTLLGPGDGFGAHALAGAGVRGTVVTIENCTLVRIPRDAFLDRPLIDPNGQSLTAGLSGVPNAPFPWVAQERAEECGVAAVTMVARFHGLQVNTTEIRPHFTLDVRGASVSNLVEVAGRIGLRAEAVRVCPEFLGGVELPVIAHLRDGHFVVLFSRSPDGLAYTVGDPARGVLTLLFASFLPMWGGVVVLIRPPSSTATERTIRARHHSELVARFQRLGTRLLGGGHDVQAGLQAAVLELSSQSHTISPEESHRWSSEAIRLALLRTIRCLATNPATQSGRTEQAATLHEAAGKLPAEEGEVFGMIFYLGWSHRRVAEVLRVSEREVKQRWKKAVASLASEVGGRLP